MIELATVGLLTAGVKLATEVVSLYSSARKTSERDVTQIAEVDSRRGEAVVERQVVVERQHVLRETTVITERVLDKEFVERIVRQAESNLDRLIEYTGETILDELRRNRVRDAVQDVKAHASSLRLLLNASELDTPVVIQLITSALNPLQVSIAKARYVIEDYGDKRRWGWDYCYLVGSAALLAGYNYLGQRPEYLEKQLIEHSRDVHAAILDEMADAMVAAGQRIPWHDIPPLLEPAGADALRTLYEQTMRANEKAIAAGRIEGEGKENTPEVPFDVGQLTISELSGQLWKVRDPRLIDEMTRMETLGRMRTGALDALRRRKRDLA